MNLKDNDDEINNSAKDNIEIGRNLVSELQSLADNNKIGKESSFLPIPHALNKESYNPIINKKEDLYIKNKQKPKTQKIIKVTNLNKSLKWLLTPDQKRYFETIMIHVHGGGFVALSSSSHQNYLIPWANKLEIPIFSIDYRLAPEFQYPEPVNDIINAYLWILTFVSEVLEVKLRNVILTGDSAGGSLSTSLTIWCIVNGVRKPDFLFLHYPFVYSGIGKCYSPSY